jgi:hypothetical protein
VLDLTETQ